jgi:sugar lactone lactonase YvrE
MFFGALVVLAAAASAANAPADLKVINKNVGFPEGPMYRGSILYYVDYGGQGVLSWDGKVNKTIYTDKQCFPTSVISFGQDLLVACFDGNYLVRIKLDGTVVKRIDQDKGGRRIIGPNDFALDDKGGVYVTASGTFSDTSIIDGRVLHVSPSMEVTELASDIHFANGIAVSPDGKNLLIAEPEAQRILSFKRNANDTLSDRRVFARVNKIDPEGGIDAYPDGIKFGPDGNLWIGEYSKPRVAVISGDGKKFIRAYDLPGKACPNVAFTPDGRSFIVAVVEDKDNAPYKGKVYSARLAP